MLVNGNHRKVYRLGLYGVSQSGKTCLLAALDMAREPNPKGYEAVRLPVSLLKPDGPPDQWPDEDPAAAAHRGEQWLDEAKIRLGKGDVPPPNNPATTHSLTFLYDFSSPEGTWQVELFDYSGELVDARMAADPTSLAASIKEHLKTMDGILVLAAVPSLDGDRSRDHEELQLLKEAFTALRGDAGDEPVLSKPVALLFNKWDRQTPDGPGDPESDRDRLSQFLVDPRFSAWQGLAQAIRNSVIEGCYESFPVSAFGGHERVERENRIIERPRNPKPLPSFSLEDGFIWAIQTIDERELNNYEQQTQPRVLLQTPWKVFRLPRAGAQLMKRFLNWDEAQQRAAVAHRRAWWFRFGWGLFHIALVTTFGLTLQLLRWDRPEKELAVNTLNNPKASMEEVHQAEGWLTAYAQAPFWRHMLLSWAFSADEAYAVIKVGRGEREMQAWQAVLNAKSESEEFNLAQKYLDVVDGFPNGPHKAEADAIIEKFNTKRRIQENEHWLVGMRLDAESAMESRDLVRIQSALDKLTKEASPHPLEIDEEFRSSRSEVIYELNVRKIEIEGDEAWRIFYAAYQSAMKEQRFDDAAEKLKFPKPEYEPFRKAKELFRDSLPEQLKKHNRDLVESQKWNDLDKLLSNLERGYSIWPEEMIPPDFAQLLSDEKRKGVLAHDNSLYEDFRRRKTETAANTYLASDLPKPMQQVVQKYLDYLEAKKHNYRFTIVLESIQWSEKYAKDNDNVVSFWVDGQRVAEVKDVDSGPGDETGEIDQYEMTKDLKLEEEVELKVQIKNIEYFIFDGIWKDKDGGEGTKKVKFSELDNYQQQLDPGHWGVCAARYRLKGGELGRIEPPLPAWRMQ